MSDGRPFRAFLSRPSAPYWLAAIGVALALPSLWGGLAADDYFIRFIQLDMAELAEFDRTPLEIFVFSRGEPDEVQASMDRGAFPWWTSAHWRLSFWRPLAALTHWFDHRFFPDSPFLMHLHNLAWYAAVCLGAAVLFRRLIRPAWVAGLAGLLYAVDDAHSFGIGWVANRNGIMAAAWGIFTLYLHDRWRRDGWRFGAVAGPAVLAVGLCSSEATIAVTGYLMAYALFIDRAPLRVRVATLVPYGAISVTWLLAYWYAGHGTTGSGIYNDPFREPLLFLSEGAQRLPVLLLGQLGTPSASLWSFLTADLARLHLVWAVVFLVFVGWMLWPMLRDDALARFWAVGMVLATVPFCATFTNDRLLFLTGLGGMGLVAGFFGARAERAVWTSGGARHWAGRILAVGWIGLHGVFSPLWTPASTLTMATVGAAIERASQSAPNGPEAKDLTVVIVNTPSDFLSCFVPVHRAGRGEVVPKHMWPLYAGIQGVRVERTAANALTVRAEGGFLPRGWSQVFRGSGYPVEPGYRVELDGLTVHVLAVTTDGQPQEVVFEFDVPLEDPSLRFVGWVGESYQPFELPEVGESVDIPDIPWYWVLQAAAG